MAKNPCARFLCSIPPMAPPAENYMAEVRTVVDFAKRSKSSSLWTRDFMCVSGTMLGPSLGALSGSWWVSMNIAATPTAAE